MWLDDTTEVQIGIYVNSFYSINEQFMVSANDCIDFNLDSKKLYYIEKAKVVTPSSELNV